MPMRLNRARSMFAVSERPTVVRPMEHGLPLLPSTVEVTRLAVFANRGDVPRDGAPPPNLPRVVARPSTHVIAAIPLKPSAGVLRVNPTMAPPLRERLGGIHTEVIESRIVPIRAQPRARKP